MPSVPRPILMAGVIGFAPAARTSDAARQSAGVPDRSVPMRAPRRRPMSSPWPNSCAVRTYFIMPLPRQERDKHANKGDQRAGERQCHLQPVFKLCECRSGASAAPPMGFTSPVKTAHAQRKFCGRSADITDSKIEVLVAVQHKSRRRARCRTAMLRRHRAKSTRR